MLLAAFVSAMIFGAGLIQSDGYSVGRPVHRHACSSRLRPEFIGRQNPIVSFPDLRYSLLKRTALQTGHIKTDAEGEITGISSGVLAEAAQKSYQPAWFSGFEVTERFDHQDLRYVVFENISRRQVIVAFPGTQTIGELLTDIAMVAGDEPVNKLLDRGLTDLGILEKIFMDSVCKCLTIKPGSDDMEVIKNPEGAQCHVNPRVTKFRKKFLNPDAIAKKMLEPKIKLIKSQIARIIEKNQSEGVDRQIFVVGHSLGGVYAQLASDLFDLAGCSFNAPGLGTVFDNCEGLIVSRSPEAEFVNFREKHDLISKFRLRSHHGTIESIDLGDPNPIVAHDMIRMVPFFKQDGELED